MKTMHSALLGAALAAALGACENAAGSGAEEGPVMEVAARGEDAPATSVSPVGGAPSHTHTSSRGAVEFRARVYVQSDAGDWTELTDGAFQRVAVDASGHSISQIFAGSRVDEGTYTRVRVVFDEVNANITAGASVGGVSLTGDVSVDTGDSLAVERAVTAQASAGFTTQLVLNLNTDVWLDHVNAATRTVSAADFASALTVSVR